MNIGVARSAKCSDLLVVGCVPQKISWARANLVGRNNGDRRKVVPSQHQVRPTAHMVASFSLWFHATDDITQPQNACPSWFVQI